MSRAAATQQIPLIRPDLPELADVEAQFAEILANGRITNFGKYVTAFEREIGTYLGAHAVTTSSGTMGLLFTLQALGLKPGSLVIVPSFTFMATVQAILYAGSRPLFADVGEDLTLDPLDLTALLEQNPGVDLVLPVHMYGLPCDTEAIENVTEQRSTAARPIRVVYDAAHAFGSSRDGRLVGTFGDAEVFSLSVTKVLVAVEGGAVTSRDAELIERIRHMRNYGIESNYNAWYPGLNGKMSEFHAIVGLANLRKLEERMERRQSIAAEYQERIHDDTNFRVVRYPVGVRHTFKDFTVLVPDSLREKRDAVMQRLKELGVEARAYFFPPVHEQKHFRRFADRPLPRTESLARRVITLPFYTSMTSPDIDYVVGALAQAQADLA
jgi:dTDP-4-amino-4,6-dideoxygalactose transaminase